MSLDQELAQLGSNLFGLPAEKVLRLAEMLERSRGTTRSDTVADAALTLLRPRLRIERPPRVLTPRRVFCRPFEDLLETNNTGTKRRGKIARNAVGPAWNAICEEADPGELAALLSATEAALQRTEEDRYLDRRMERGGALVWPFASQQLDRILGRAAAHRDYRNHLMKRLNDPAIYYELVDMAGLLRIAEKIREMSDVLSPKPVDAVGDEHLRAIKMGFLAVAQMEGGQPAYLAMVALARLGDPFALVALSSDMAAIDSGFPQENLATFTHVTLAESMGHYAEEIASADKLSMDDRTIADLGRDYAQRLSRFASTMNTDTIRAARRTIDGAKQKLREMVNEGVVTDAFDIVTAGVIDAITAKRRVAGFNEPDDAMAVRLQIAAETRARALRKCLLFADDIGMKREVQAKIDAISRDIQGAAARMLSGLMAADVATAEGRIAAEAEIYSAVRMLELVAGAQTADKLRRDGLARIAERAAECTP